MIDFPFNFFVFYSMRDFINLIKYLTEKLWEKIDEYFKIRRMLIENW